VRVPVVEATAVAAHDAMRGWSRPGEQALVALAVRVFGRGAVVLDAGVGSGLTALPLARAGLHVIGLDLAPLMLRALLHRRDVSLPVAIADVAALPIATGQLHGAFVSNVLHHVVPWEQALRELSRALRPQGQLLLNLGDGPAEGEVAEVGEFVAAALAERGAVAPAQADSLSVARVHDVLAGLGHPLHETVVVEDETWHPLADVVGWHAHNPWQQSDVGTTAARRLAAVAALAWGRDRYGEGELLRRTRNVRFYRYGSPG